MGKIRFHGAIKRRKTMKCNVFDVAKYILEQCGEMTTMKLQKMVYYCQAYSLAWDDEPIFDEDFQAWANGPVCRELYDKHKGKFRIGVSDIQPYCNEKCDFNKDQIETMDVIIKDYGEETPHWLSELTHSERPWQEARKGIPPLERSTEIISKESMQDFYGAI